MAKLMRKTVLQVVAESTLGTDPGSGYQTLVARQGTEITISGEQITRDTLRNTLSPRGHVIGRKEQTMTVPLELRGAGLDGSNNLQVPELDALLKASAMTRESAARLVVSSVTGTFERGESVTNSTASNTVGTVADWDSANNVLWIRDLQNMPSATDSITGDTSTASATVDSADEAYAYRPYSPDVDQMPSAAVRYFIDGTRHRVLAARCSFTLNLSVGQIPQISFSVNGVYEKPTDDTNPSATALSLIPEPVFGAGLIIGGLDMTTVTVNAVTADLANDVQWRDDIQAASGRKEALVVGRDPTGSIDPEATTLSAFDPYNDWENANEVAIAAGIGSAAGKRLRVVMPKTQYTELPYGERNGILTYQLGFRASGTDDELILLYA